MRIIILLFLLIIFKLSHAFAQAELNKDARFSFCKQSAVLNYYQDISDKSIDDLVSNNLMAERIVVSKAQKRLIVLSGNSIIRSIPVVFGFNFSGGKKQFEGDGKTPEGIYFIDSKNNKSKYHLALHTSYPNAQDIAYADKFNKTAGSDIMIHGFPTQDKDLLAVAQEKHSTGFHWTEGCVAMTNAEIREVFDLTKTGTLVEFCPM